MKVTIPLMKDRDEVDDVTARLGLEKLSNLSLPRFPKLDFRLKTWTVPLSLETANHWAVGENARLYISALSAPLLTCIKESSESWRRENCKLGFQ